MSPDGTAAAMQGQAIAQGKALVPVASGRSAPPAGRAHAAFLTHLIATRRELPQTRARRRVEPGEAARAYRARLARPAPRPVLSRSL
jgi:hypothetical protein